MKHNKLLSYIKDVFLENSMEHNADQAIEKYSKQIFNSIVVEWTIFHTICCTWCNNSIKPQILQSSNNFYFKSENDYNNKILIVLRFLSE